MTRVGPNTPAYARPGDSESLQAARGLEANFLRQMLAEVRQSSEGNGMLDGGFAGSTFQEMLDGALADGMARSGGIGLAKILQKELERDPHGAAQSSAPLAHAPPLPALAPPSGPRSLPLSPVGANAAITSAYGVRPDPIDGDPRMHAGVDLRAAAGTPARAAEGGTVVRAGEAGGYGYLVEVDHGHGLTTRYAHLQHINVAVGQHVEAGDAVGEVGATGRTTGPHLHFEVRQDGHAMDPTSPLKFSR
jgi:murein DD-endopeptidase MepM/ murein hydrolase activator NlpD